MTKMKTLRFLEKEQGMIHQAPQEEEGDPRQVPKEAEVATTPLGEMITTAGTAMGNGQLQLSIIKKGKVEKR